MKKLMNVFDEIALKIETNGNKDRSGVIVRMKVTAGRKNSYYIDFPKTDSAGSTRLSWQDFVGQFEDHWETGLMDYDGSPETANPIVELSLFDASWLIENRKLALAWPLLKHEKGRWSSREEQYNYMVNNRNDEFSCSPTLVNLNETQHVVLRADEL